MLCFPKDTRANTLIVPVDHMHCIWSSVVCVVVARTRAEKEEIFLVNKQMRQCWVVFCVLRPAWTCSTPVCHVQQEAILCFSRSVSLPQGLNRSFVHSFVRLILASPYFGEVRWNYIISRLVVFLFHVFFSRLSFCFIIQSIKSAFIHIEIYISWIFIIAVARAFIIYMCMCSSSGSAAAAVVMWPSLCSFIRLYSTVQVLVEYRPHKFPFGQEKFT